MSVTPRLQCRLTKADGATLVRGICALGLGGGPRCSERCLYDPTELAAMAAEATAEAGAETEAGAPYQVGMVVRGRAATFILRRDDRSLRVTLALALLALEDPRVDAVLHACGVALTDASGRQVWP